MKALLSVLLLCSTFAFGQRRVDVDVDVTMQSGAFFQAVNGVPVATNVYYRVVEGSAYFKDNWMRGTVSLGPGQEYKNLLLKLNLLENQLHFKDTKGNELICTTPLNKLLLTDSATGRTHTFVHSSFIPAFTELRTTWLEQLADGPVQLYAQYKKNMSETRPYGSATLEQRILTGNIYYLVSGGQSLRVKKLSDIVKALPADKKAAAQQWIKTNEPDERNPDDFARLLTWYNGLPK